MEVDGLPEEVPGGVQQAGGGGGLNYHIKIFSCYRKIWSWEREDNYTVDRGLSCGSMDVGVAWIMGPWPGVRKGLYDFSPGDMTGCICEWSGCVGGLSGGSIDADKNEELSWLSDHGGGPVEGTGCTCGILGEWVTRLWRGGWVVRAQAVRGLA